MACEERRLRRLLSAQGSFKAQPIRSFRDYVHHSAERIGAIELRTAALHHFNRGNFFFWDALPVDPSTKRVIQRFAVLDHQRAARASCAHAAQGNTLRCWISRSASAAAKERKPGDLSQRIVNRESRGS